MAPLGEMLVQIVRGARHECLLVAPYIKSSALERILAECVESCSVRIVTRWRIDELALGVSDLDVWELVRERRGTELWLQPALHAKYYRGDDQIALGSANLTNMGLGWAAYSNLEILEDRRAEFAGREDFEGRLFQNAIQVDQELYERFETALAAFPSQPPSPPPPKDLPSTENVWRPRLRHPADLFAFYEGKTDDLTTTAREAAAIDLAALQPPPGLTQDGFKAWVKLAILQSPEFRAIDHFVLESRRFGEMRNLMRDFGAPDAGLSWQTWMRWTMHFLPDQFDFHTAKFSEIVSRPGVRAARR